MPAETEIVSHSFTEDDNTDAIIASGGEYVFSHQGSDYGGGSLSLQYSEDGGTTWTTVAGTSYGAALQVGVTTGAGTKYRMSLSGSTSPTITASFRKTRPQNVQ